MPIYADKKNEIPSLYFGHSDEIKAQSLPNLQQNDTRSTQSVSENNDIDRTLMDKTFNIPSGSSINNHSANSELLMKEERKKQLKERISEDWINQLPQFIEYNEKGYNTQKLDKERIEILKEFLPNTGPLTRLQAAIKSFLSILENPDLQLKTSNIVQLINSLIVNTIDAMEAMNASEKISRVSWKKEVERASSTLRNNLIAETIKLQEDKLNLAGGSTDYSQSTTARRTNQLGGLLFSESYLLTAEQNRFKRLENSLLAEDRVSRKKLAVILEGKSAAILTSARDAREFALNQQLKLSSSGGIRNAEQLTLWKISFHQYARYISTTDEDLKISRERNPLIDAVKKYRSDDTTYSHFLSTLPPLADALGEVVTILMQNTIRIQPSQETDIPRQKHSSQNFIKKFLNEKKSALSQLSLMLIEKTKKRNSINIQSLKNLVSKDSDGANPKAMNNALLLLDLIQQCELKIKNLPSLLNELQEAEEQYNILKFIPPYHIKEPELCELLNQKLNQEAERWQVIINDRRKRLETMMEPLIQLTHEGWVQDHLFMLQNKLRETPLGTGEWKGIYQFEKSIEVSINDIKKIATEVNDIALSSENKYTSDEDRLERKVTKWLSRLQNIKSCVKTSVAALNHRGLDNFSRSGMLVRGISEWVENLKHSYLQCQEVTAEDFECAMGEIMYEYRQHFSKKSDPDGQRFIQRLTLARKNTEAGTTVYPPTPEEVLAGMRSIPEDIRRWAKRRVVTASLSALFKGGINLITGWISFPVRVVIRGGLTCIAISRGHRAAARGVRSGRGPATRVQNSIVNREMAKMAFKMTLSISPTGSGLTAAALSASQYVAQPDNCKKITKDILLEIPESLFWEGVSHGANTTINNYILHHTKSMVEEGVDELVDQLSEASAQENSSLDAPAQGAPQLSSRVKRATESLISDSAVPEQDAGKPVNKQKATSYDEIISKAQKECQDEIAAGNKSWGFYKEMWHKYSYNTASIIFGEGVDLRYYAQNRFQSGATKMLNDLLLFIKKTEELFENNDLDEKEENQLKAIYILLNKKIDETFTYIRKINDLLETASDLHSWDFMSDAMELINGKAPKIENIIDTFKSQAMLHFIGPMNEKVISKEDALKFFYIIMNNPSDDLAPVQKKMQDYVKLREYMLYKYLSYDEYEVQSISKAVENIELQQYINYTPDSLEETIFKYRVNDGHRQTYIPLKEVKTETESYAISNDDFYKILKEYIDKTALLEAQNSTYKSLSLVRDKFNSKIDFNDKLLSVKYYNISMLLIIDDYKIPLDFNEKIAITESHSGEKYIILTFTETPYIIKHSDEIERGIRLISNVSSLCEMIKKLYNKILSEKEIKLIIDSIPRGIEQRFILSTDSSFKNSMVNENKKSIKDLFVTHFYNIYKENAVAIKENGNSSFIGTLLHTIPFFSVIIRKIHDPDYNPTASDMAMDIASVAIPLGLSALLTANTAYSIIKSSLEAAFTAIGKTGKILKGVELYSESLRIVMPGLLKEIPSLKTTLSAFFLISAETMNPLAVFQPLKFAGEKTVSGIKKLSKLSKGTRYLDETHDISGKKLPSANITRQPNQNKSLYDGQYCELPFMCEITGDSLSQVQTTVRADLGYSNIKLSNMASHPMGMCDQAARQVISDLSVKGYQTKVIGCLFYKNFDDTAPLNHYAVIANKNGTYLVIDVTFEQFTAKAGREGKILLTSPEEWQRKLVASDQLKNKLIIFKEYDTLAAAENDIKFTDNQRFIESKHVSDNDFKILHTPEFFIKHLNHSFQKDVKKISEKSFLNEIESVENRINLAEKTLSNLNIKKLKLIGENKNIPDSLINNITKTQLLIANLNDIKSLPQRINNYSHLLNIESTFLTGKSSYRTSVCRKILKHLDSADTSKLYDINSAVSFNEQGLAIIGENNYLVVDGKLHLVNFTNKMKTEGILKSNGKPIKIEYKKFHWKKISDAISDVKPLVSESLSEGDTFPLIGRGLLTTSEYSPVNISFDYIRIDKSVNMSSARNHTSTDLTGDLQGVIKYSTGDKVISPKNFGSATSKGNLDSSVNFMEISPGISGVVGIKIPLAQIAENNPLLISGGTLSENTMIYARDTQYLYIYHTARAPGDNHWLTSEQGVESVYKAHLALKESAGLFPDGHKFTNQDLPIIFSDYHDVSINYKGTDTSLTGNTRIPEQKYSEVDIWDYNNPPQNSSSQSSGLAYAVLGRNKNGPVIFTYSEIQGVAPVGNTTNFIHSNGKSKFLMAGVNNENIFNINNSLLLLKHLSDKYFLSETAKTINEKLSGDNSAERQTLADSSTSTPAPAPAPAPAPETLLKPKIKLLGEYDTIFSRIDLSEADSKLRITVDCNKPHSAFTNKNYATISIRDKSGKIRHTTSISGNDDKFKTINEKLLIGEKLEIFHQEPSRLKFLAEENDSAMKISSKINHVFLRTENGLEEVGKNSPEFLFLGVENHLFGVVYVDTYNKKIKVDVLSENPNPFYAHDKYASIGIDSIKKDNSASNSTRSFDFLKQGLKRKHHEFPLNPEDIITLYHAEPQRRIVPSAEVRESHDQGTPANKYKLVDDRLVNIKKTINLYGEKDKLFGELIFDAEKNEVSIKNTSPDQIIHSAYRGMVYAVISITDSTGSLVCRRIFYGNENGVINDTIPLKEGYRIHIYHAEIHSPPEANFNTHQVEGINFHTWTKYGLEPFCGSDTASC